MSTIPNTHVLVVGVDGTRFDVLDPALTPALCGLGAAGFLTPVMLDDSTPSWSGPCWATIATGVGVSGHGITGNDLTGHRLAEHPDFLTVATRAGLPTFLAVSGWHPLAVEQDGGPLFAEAARREFVPVPDETMPSWDAADEATTQAAVQVLAGAGAPRLTFVYLGAVDVAGHWTGNSPAYRTAAQAADARVGRLLATVRSRPRFAEESWTFVAVTDHGHIDAGGHGGREPEVVTAWAAGAGPGIDPAGPPPITAQTDVAPFVLAVLADPQALS